MKALLLTSTAAALAVAATTAARASESSAELLYVAGGGKAARAYVIGEDGTAKRRLTTSRYAESDPEYSRDGKLIVFSSIRDGTNQDIYVMNADGTGVRRVTKHRQPDFSPTLSPDGRRIAYVSIRSGSLRIYVVDVDGTGDRLLTRTEKWVGNSGPAWSPDGRWIAFSSTRLEDGNPEIFKMRPDGSQLTRLTFTDTSDEVSPDDGLPSWSPDGRSIVFSSTRANGQHDLWVMRSDGKRPRRVTNTPRFDDWNASFSRDGRRIVFEAAPPGGLASEVYVVNVEGSGLRRVVAGKWPVWRP